MAIEEISYLAITIGSGALVLVFLYWRKHRSKEKDWGNTPDD